LDVGGGGGGGVGKVWGIFWLWFDFTSTMRECMGVELGDHEFLSS
jgi:hypothetical protein